MLTTDDYMALPPGRPDLRAPYGDHPDQFGELYLPPGAGPHPPVVLVHGGCWRAQYGLAPLGPLCEALRAAGYAVWSLEYRRIGGGGGWPATFADVAAGADALHGLAAPLDLGRVVAAGHSAGGQLALWLAARPRLPRASALWAADPLPIRGVLALAALADLAAAAGRALCGTAVPELLGGSPAERPERYAEASPAALLPLGLPHVHLVGAADPIVPPDYLAAFVAAARAAGDDASLTVLPAAGHFEVVAPAPPAWDELLAALRGLGA
ncbi:MAG TPA: alpha/beta hydrolase [Chloroflexaceae bacterium]|nr:alpha/beta hydrolase [Chloroflexaceae bacterium]